MLERSPFQGGELVPGVGSVAVRTGPPCTRICGLLPDPLVRRLVLAHVQVMQRHRITHGWETEVGLLQEGWGLSMYVKYFMLNGPSNIFKHACGPLR